MKYYAVADDPSELMHYGVKGMKWGQHIFGDKPRSPGFKKAVSKLRASMKNGIKAKQAHWKQSSEMRSAKREAKREFNEAKVARQADARLAEALGAQAAKEIRRDRRAARREVNREARAERREQRNMDRYMQKARHGTLKYKKLRDDQIQSIAERLNLENQARRLSGNETPHMLTRIRRSIGEGVVRGVGAAVATGIEENARARAKYKASKKYGDKQAAIDARNQRARDKERAKYAKEEAEEAQDREYYTMLAETGEKQSRSERRGRNARINRQQKLNDYKRKQADDDFNKEIRQNVMRGMTQRQKGDTNEDYLARITSDWRERIGYQTYSPSPSAKVVKRQEKQQKREYNKQSKRIEKLQRQAEREALAAEREALAAEQERQRRADEAERQSYRANVERALNQVGRAEAERNFDARIAAAKLRETNQAALARAARAQEIRSNFGNYSDDDRVIVRPRSKIRRVSNMRVTTNFYRDRY